MKFDRFGALMASTLLTSAVLVPLTAVSAHADPILDLCGGAADNYAGSYAGGNSGGQLGIVTHYTLTMRGDGTFTAQSKITYSDSPEQNFGPTNGTFTVASFAGLGPVVRFTPSADVLPAAAALPVCNLGSNRAQKIDFKQVFLNRTG